MTALDVIYEDNHLLIINKPTGIATMGAESGETVHSLAAAYLKQKYAKPGNVYLGIVSRLDMMTSGVMVLARTSKAASRLVPQFGATKQSKRKTPIERATKIYLAAVSGELDHEQGKLADYVRKDDAAHRMRLVAPETAGAQAAESEYVTVGQLEDVSIVAVRLMTGRKHQIRVQFADRGHPLIGDRKYGSADPFPIGIALHSWYLRIAHPTRKEACSWYAEMPESWKSLASAIPNRIKLVAIVNEAFGIEV